MLSYTWYSSTVGTDFIKQQKNRIRRTQLWKKKNWTIFDEALAGKKSSIENHFLNFGNTVVTHFWCVIGSAAKGEYIVQTRNMSPNESREPKFWMQIIVRFHKPQPGWTTASTSIMTWDVCIPTCHPTSSMSGAHVPQAWSTFRIVAE